MFKWNFKYFKLFVCCLLVQYCAAQPAPLDQKYIDSITPRLANRPDDSVKVNQLKTLASMYILVDPTLTIKYTSQGIAIAEKIDYPFGKITCLGQRAFLYAITGEWAKATADVNEAIPLCEQHYPGLLVYMYNLMYIVAATKEDDGEALMYAQKAQNHSSFAALPELRKWPTYMQLGRMYEHLNQIDSAEHYARILENYVLKYGLSEPDLASNSNTLLGSLALRKKEYAKAINFFRLGTNYPSISTVYNILGQTDSVIHYSTLALQNGESQKNFNLIQQAAKQLSVAYHETDTEKAYLYLNKYAAAKDSLYNSDKIRQLESIKLNEQKKYFDLEKATTATRNQLILLSLFVLLVSLVIFLVMLWRNNRFKQRANARLESAYENLQATQAQLIQSEKMASLGELTAGIAHEIQNPLNFVNNFSEVNNELIHELKAATTAGNMNEVLLLANDIAANGEKINHHGKRADAIVKGMLQHSQKSSGQKEPTDINALCDEYIRLAYHGLRAKDKSFNAEFKTDFDSSIEKVNIIPQNIGRVLLNLYNNAFYAVNEKKETAGENYQPTVSVQTKRANDAIEIIVADNGAGIPKTIVNKIFQPFFTTKPTGQGTGLGLSLSYDIIKTQGGEIKVESKEGEGSAFIIQL